MISLNFSPAMEAYDSCIHAGLIDPRIESWLKGIAPASYPLSAAPVPSIAATSPAAAQAQTAATNEQPISLLARDLLPGSTPLPPLPRSSPIEEDDWRIVRPLNAIERHMDETAVAMVRSLGIDVDETRAPQAPAKPSMEETNAAWSNSIDRMLDTAVDAMDISQAERRAANYPVLSPCSSPSPWSTSSYDGSFSALDSPSIAADTPVAAPSHADEDESSLSLDDDPSDADVESWSERGSAKLRAMLGIGQ